MQTACSDLPFFALPEFCGLQQAVIMHAGFPGVNTEFQELVKACAEAALETNDSKLKTMVRHEAFSVAYW